MHPLNISVELVTLLVFHPLPTKILANLLQLLNIENISVTLAVLKLLRSRVVSLLQPKNIKFMLVTLSVCRYSSPSMS